MPKDRNGRLIANPNKCIDIDRVGPFLSLSLSARSFGMRVTQHLLQKRLDCTNFSQSSRCDGIWIRIVFLFSDSPMHQIDKSSNGVIFNLDLLIFCFEHWRGFCLLFSGKSSEERSSCQRDNPKDTNWTMGAEGKDQGRRKQVFIFFRSIDVRRNNWRPFITPSSKNESLR